MEVNKDTYNCARILQAMPAIAPKEFALRTSKPSKNTPPMLPRIIPSTLLNSSHIELTDNVAI